MKHSHYAPPELNYTPYDHLVNFRPVPGCNRLFRSSYILLAEKHGISTLAKQLGINTYIDFRNKGEQKAEQLKEQLHDHQIQYLNFEIAGYEANLKQTLIPSPEDYVDYYERILDKGKKAFKNFFQFLAKNCDTNVVFACYSGKDRTGIAAILLLHILGAPKEVIQEDFLATNAELANKLTVFEKNWTKRGLTPEAYLQRIQIDTITFDLLLNRIRKVFGGIDQYLFEELQLTQEEIEQISTNHQYRLS